MKPRALILRAAGTNCDVEIAHAFERAGAKCEFVHVNRLLENRKLLGDFQLLAIPGGFSYGDDIAAGRILANQIMHHLRGAFADFVAAGKPVIGVCNGFQVLVKTDLLPGRLGDTSGQSCTLTNNDCGRFVDRWIHLQSRSNKCIWTRHLSAPSPRTPLFPSPGTPGEGQGEGDFRTTIDLPIAHGEGKFVPASESVRKALWDNDQVALVYVRPDGSPANGELPDNPNGSVDDIAGVCDASGLVFGLMPHPERFVEAIQHPAWTRRPRESEGAGLQFFRQAVVYVQDAVGAGT